MKFAPEVKNLQFCECPAIFVLLNEDTMNLYINEERRLFYDVGNLSEVFINMGMNSFAGIAVALNNTVIPKSEWEITSIKDHDKITIVTATQGG